MIIKCENNCKSAFQDKRYGEGKRVHNPMPGDKWRCSVCEKARDKK